MCFLYLEMKKKRETHLLLTKNLAFCHSSLTGRSPVDKAWCTAEVWLSCLISQQHFLLPCDWNVFTDSLSLWQLWHKTERQSFEHEHSFTSKSGRKKEKKRRKNGKMFFWLNPDLLKMLFLSVWGNYGLVTECHILYHTSLADDTCFL